MDNWAVSTLSFYGQCCFESSHMTQIFVILKINKVTLMVLSLSFLNLNFITILVIYVCCCCCCWVTSVVSDSVRPHRQQPTRLLFPWDSPGKNTGVGCQFLLQCMKVKSESEVAQACRLLATPWTRLLHPCYFPGKSTQVGCHCLLQNIS